MFKKEVCRRLWPGIVKAVFCTVLCFVLELPAGYCQQVFTETAAPNSIGIAGAAATAPICTDTRDYMLVQKSAALLQQDIDSVTGRRPLLVHSLPPATANTIIIIGTIERSTLIRDLVKRNKINIAAVHNQWEAYCIQVIDNPFKGIRHALVITGSDQRGVAYGVTELSLQMGVSPWYWWADVPVKKKKALYIPGGFLKTDSPLVKYRGIFINDEAPALSGWATEKFGGFNHAFYEKVFELLIRLKSNYIWPAMWGHAFYDDDSLNIKMAEQYGMVIGTSHHEPLMRAHDEWRRYGAGEWNYEHNAARLQAFWKKGLQRATNEKVVTIGMRGDGDKPMSEGTAVSLLEKIVRDQRQLITEVTGKPAAATPQLWALYKEVQDYYDKGMQVPDDITLLLCDDNWGNIRKLPRSDEPARKGGYGIYYHFDYVGGPRNYKWLNTNALPRVWEQMHLAWEYKARQIWIVNVGDIKPMELPVSFFLDYAWNPTRIGPAAIQPYTERWAGQQFGDTYAKHIAHLLQTYTKYNARRKPELLDASTYSLVNYNEADRITNDWAVLQQQAEQINNTLPEAYRSAYYQLVLHPIQACANLQQLYTAVAKNQFEASHGSPMANTYAAQAIACYRQDSVITARYHALNQGKWNHFMDQTHIGYTGWQEPRKQKMPVVKYVETNSGSATSVHDAMGGTDEVSSLSPADGTHQFGEQQGYVSIEADHYTRAINTHGITWTVLPDHGRTGSAITPFPVTAATQTPGRGSPCLEYNINVHDTGSMTLAAYFSPTLNFHNTANGLQYGVSIDEEAPQIVSINKEDNNTDWNKWVADNIIIKTTRHTITQPGKHVIKYWMVHPGVVLQKLVLDAGGVRSSYLGAPETLVK
jgi:hypothetical protein